MEYLHSHQFIMLVFVVSLLVLPCHCSRSVHSLLQQDQEVGKHDVAHLIISKGGLTESKRSSAPPPPGPGLDKPPAPHYYKSPPPAPPKAISVQPCPQHNRPPPSTCC
ncbi:CRIB domain-containing protein [Dioscorea alata]|uniref:CRIB domain-containing protein n=1 Tax=Dioscorea alata TaxID=55571 RepID=A0ACB7WQK1_DIOAL|nr:CRIB domain-containing protein [Dioscorea alata]